MLPIFFRFYIRARILGAPASHLCFEPRTRRYSLRFVCRSKDLQAGRAGAWSSGFGSYSEPRCQDIDSSSLWKCLKRRRSPRCHLHHSLLGSAGSLRSTVGGSSRVCLFWTFVQVDCQARRAHRIRDGIRCQLRQARLCSPCCFPGKAH